MRVNQERRRMRTQKITYLYRDAGNYKFWGEFFVCGNLSFNDLKPYLFDEEYFVPEKIGLPSLVPKIRNDDDHLLHEFFSIEAGKARSQPISAEDLLAGLRDAHSEGWF
jgi:hypothetical protein